jgi:periplasmic divalent cation tolerance protein
MTEGSYCVVMTTAESEDDAKSLARRLVEQRLVACAQITPIRSVFRWEGQVDEAEECLLLLKTADEVYGALEAYLLEHHPYDLPEIVKVPVSGGSGAYLQWMTDQTRSAAA